MEDIDSDDDDSFLRDEDDKKLSSSMSPSSFPTASSQPRPALLSDGGVSGRCRKVTGCSPVTSGMPSKEELLMMMDKVDRDIAAVEMQISALQKKQVGNNVLRKVGRAAIYSSAAGSLAVL